MGRNLHPFNGLKIRMHRAIQLILEKLFNISTAKLRRRQADIVNHHQLNFGLLGALVKIRRSQLTCAQQLPILDVKLSRLLHNPVLLQNKTCNTRIAARLMLKLSKANLNSSSWRGGKIAYFYVTVLR